MSRLALVLALGLAACGGGDGGTGPSTALTGGYVAASWDGKPLPLVLGTASTGFPTGGTTTLLVTRHEYTALRLQLDQAGRHYELRGDLRLTPVEGNYSAWQRNDVPVDAGTFGFDAVKGELIFTAPGNDFSLRNGTVAGNRLTVHARWVFEGDSTDVVLVFNR